MTLRDQLDSSPELRCLGSKFPCVLLDMEIQPESTLPKEWIRQLFEFSTDEDSIGGIDLILDPYGIALAEDLEKRFGPWKPGMKIHQYSQPKFNNPAKFLSLGIPDGWQPPVNSVTFDWALIGIY